MQLLERRSDGTARDMREPESGEGRLEAARRKWQAIRIAANESRHARRGSGPCDVDHLRGHIDRDQLAGRGCDEPGPVAGAASDLEGRPVPESLRQPIPDRAEVRLPLRLQID